MGKILQLVYDLNCGGVEAFVTNLNSCEDVFDVQIVVCTVHPVLVLIVR